MVLMLECIRMAGMVRTMMIRSLYCHGYMNTCIIRVYKCNKCNKCNVMNNRQTIRVNGAMGNAAHAGMIYMMIYDT